MSVVAVQIVHEPHARWHVGITACKAVLSQAWLSMPTHAAILIGV